MASTIIPFEELGFGEIKDQSASANWSSERMDGGKGRKTMDSHGPGSLGELGGIDSSTSDYGFYQDRSSEEVLNFSKYQQQEEQEQLFVGYQFLDDLRVDIMSPPLQTCLEEISKLSEKGSSSQEDVEVEPKERQKQNPFSLASLELLKNYSRGVKRSNNERLIESSDVKPPPCAKASQRLSAEEITKIAGARFIQSSSQTIDVESTLINPYDYSFSTLSDEEVENVELVELLLASAEKVGYQQFECANRLLKHCDHLSSSTGNAVQRVVYYFSEALQERIDRETGRIRPKGLLKEQKINIYEAMMAPSHSNVAFYQGIPFAQVSQFAGIQAIVENVAEATRIHIIDIGIRSGEQWTILMPALMSRHECPLELLKITAIGTTSKQLIENTGRRLMSFAQTMNLPLLFKIVMVSDMLELKEDLFEIDAEETVAVYSEYLLASFIAQNRLDTLMQVIANINPCIMVISEVEANHNSPVFVDRFIEALFYSSAYFDSFETCMERDDPNRMIVEKVFFGEGVKKIVAAEGEERSIRNVKIEVWRSFFARFGMEEMELSMSSLYQAKLVLENFVCGTYCTLKMDGKSLIVGWKGTPIHSLSVWKFI